MYNDGESERKWRAVVAFVRCFARQKFIHDGRFQPDFEAGTSRIQDSCITVELPWSINLDVIVAMVCKLNLTQRELLSALATMANFQVLW
jgi:hypothetical protein